MGRPCLHCHRPWARMAPRWRPRRGRENPWVSWNDFEQYLKNRLPFDHRSNVFVFEAILCWTQFAASTVLDSMTRPMDSRWNLTEQQRIVKSETSSMNQEAGVTTAPHRSINNQSTIATNVTMMEHSVGREQRAGVLGQHEGFRWGVAT